MKKLGAILLGAAFLAGACYPLAACTFGEHNHTFAEGWTWDSEQHWHAATCGHDEERDGLAAHTFTDGVCGVCGYSIAPENPYEPGDVVTDKAVRTAINENLLALSVSDMGASFYGNLAGSYDGKEFDELFDGIVRLVRVSDPAEQTEPPASWWEGDAGVTFKGADADSYLLAYLRKENAYAGRGVWESEQHDYAAALGTYRTEGGSALYSGSISETTGVSSAAIATDLLPVLVKFAKNCFVYTEGEIVKTEDGYSMTVSLLDAADQILGDVRSAVSSLKEGVLLPVGYANGVGDLLKQPSIDNMLRTLLSGISADELLTILGYIASEDTMSAFPKATSDMGAFDYLWECLCSPELAVALANRLIGSDGLSGLEDYLTDGLSSVPLEFVWTKLFDKSFVQSEILAKLDEVRADLKGTLLRAVLGGEAAGDADLVFTALFDEEYAIVSVGIDASFEGLSGVLSVQDENGETVSKAVALDGAVHAEVGFFPEGAPLADLEGVNTQPFPLPASPEGTEGEEGGVPAV